MLLECLPELTRCTSRRGRTLQRQQQQKQHAAFEPTGFVPAASATFSKLESLALSAADDGMFAGLRFPALTELILESERVRIANLTAVYAYDAHLP